MIVVRLHFWKKCYFNNKQLLELQHRFSLGALNNFDFRLAARIQGSDFEFFAMNFARAFRYSLIEIYLFLYTCIYDVYEKKNQKKHYYAMWCSIV